MRKETTIPASKFSHSGELPSENINTIRSRRWRLAHPERARMLQARYRSHNRTRRLLIEAAWRKKNAKKCRAYQARFRQHHKVRIESKRLQTVYHLTPTQANVYIASPCGLCPICFQQRKLVIDHHHSTGLVRGRICRSCNLLLGRADENIPLLQQAVAYLTAWQVNG